MANTKDEMRLPAMIVCGSDNMPECVNILKIQKKMRSIFNDCVQPDASASMIVCGSENML
jgi:hypothetical protein